MLLSVWQDRHPRDSSTAPPTLGGEYDVVVVGAGITGLTTALLLARAGRSVTVVEARWVGAGTTGGSTAKVSLLQGTRLSMIDRRHPPATVRAYAQANATAQAWLSRFCDDHGVAVQRRPAVTFATTERGAARVRSELDLARRVGLPATSRDPVGLPFRTTAAVGLDDQLQVDPLELLEALVEQCLAHGVQLVEGVRVRRVTGADPVVVEGETGTARAATVVVATNLPFLDRGGFFARMSPARSYGLAYRTDEPAVDAMYLSSESPSRSLRDCPAPDGDLLLVGGNGHTTGRGGSEAARVDELRRWTAEHFPGAEETHAWSAQDYVPHHQLPFAGPVLPGQEHLLVAGGYAKWGMTNGVAAALALTARQLGERLDWADVLEPWRGREARGAVDAARINGGVGLEMLTGWLRPVLHPGVGPAPNEADGTVRLDRPGTPTAVARSGGVERRTSAVCTHLGGIVRWNDAEHSWDCPLHGSRFAPDGGVLEGPATCGLRRR